MAKSKASYVCQACGAVHPRWMGRCDACGEWNSVIEEVSSSAPIGGKASGGAGRGRPIEMSSLADTNTKELPPQLALPQPHKEPKTKDKDKTLVSYLP